MKNLIRKAVLTSIASLALLPIIGQSANASNDRFGAIAYSPSTRVSSSASAWTKAAAHNSALADCRRQSGANDCKIVVGFKNAWGALAIASNGAYGSAYGYNTNHPANGEYIARRLALNYCRQVGAGCQIVLTRSAISIAIDNGPALHPAND